MAVAPDEQALAHSSRPHNVRMELIVKLLAVGLGGWHENLLYLGLPSDDLGLILTSQGALEMHHH